MIGAALTPLGAGLIAWAGLAALALLLRLIAGSTR